jgi:hypothetical protein
MRLQHNFNVASKEQYTGKTDRQIDSYYIRYFPFAPRRSRRRCNLKYEHNNFSDKGSFYNWRLSRIVFDINCFRLWFGKIQFTFIFFIFFYLRTYTFIMTMTPLCDFRMFFHTASAFGTGNGNDTGGIFFRFGFPDYWMDGAYYAPNPNLLSSKLWTWSTKVTDTHTDTHTETSLARHRFIHKWICVKTGIALGLGSRGGRRLCQSYTEDFW